jgi:hypothetical protein
LGQHLHASHIFDAVFFRRSPPKSLSVLAERPRRLREVCPVGSRLGTIRSGGSVLLICENIFRKKLNCTNAKGTPRRHRR